MYYNNDHDSSNINDSEHNIAKKKKKEIKEMTSLFKFTKGLKECWWEYYSFNPSFINESC
jgi:hypothetical protein